MLEPKYTVRVQLSHGMDGAFWDWAIFKEREVISKGSTQTKGGAKRCAKRALKQIISGKASYAPQTEFYYTWTNGKLKADS